MESFKLTEQSYEKLKKDGFPEDILNKLRRLENHSYKDENDFVETIEKVIGSEQTVKYKSAILESAKIIMYDAFISYARNDVDFAAALQEKLERNFSKVHRKFRKKKQRIEIIRDVTDLENEPDLWKEIKEKLYASRFLIVICSPSAAQKSKWVSKEIEAFIAEQKNKVASTTEPTPSNYNNIIPILFKTEKNDLRLSFPKPLMFEAEPPMAIEFRKEVIERNQKYEKYFNSEGLDRIYAKLLGLKYRIFAERQEKYRKQKIRLIISIACGIAALFAILSFVAVVGWHNANEQKKEALANESDSLSRIADQVLESGDTLEAIKISLQALPSILGGLGGERPTIPRAEESLYRAVARNRVVSVLEGTSFKITKQSLDSLRLEEVPVNTVNTIEKKLINQEHIGENKFLDFLKETIGEEQTTRYKSLFLKYARDGHKKNILDAVFTSDQKYVLTISRDGTIRRWNIDSEGKGRSEKINEYRDDFKVAQFSNKGDYAITASPKNQVYLWVIREPEKPRPLSKHEDHRGDVRKIAFSPDDKYVMTGLSDGAALLWEIPTGEFVTEIPYKHKELISSVAFSHDSKYVATGSKDGKVFLWRVQGDRPKVSLKRELILDEHTKRIRSIAFSPKKIRSGYSL
jgi:hypothetical protein